MTRRTIVVAFCLIVTASAASAEPLEEGDRRLNMAVGISDLDRGSEQGIDLGVADGPELAVSIGWMRSRVVELGLRASYADLDLGDSDLVDVRVELLEFNGEDINRSGDPGELGRDFAPDADFVRFAAGFLYTF